MTAPSGLPRGFHAVVVGGAGDIGTALRRRGRPEEVAGMVVFPRVAEAGHATGSVYAVDGGFLAG